VESCACDGGCDWVLGAVAVTGAVLGVGSCGSDGGCDWVLGAVAVAGALPEGGNLSGCLATAVLGELYLFLSWVTRRSLAR